MFTALPENSALLTAVSWISGVLTGPLATAIGILSVALVGFAMLAGRVDWQRGVRVVIGLFLVFGAPAIAVELRTLARGYGPDFRSMPAIAPVAPTPPASPASVCWTCNPLDEQQRVNRVAD